MLSWWKRVAKRIGDFQARAILTVFYFLVVAPFALLIRWLGDPLCIKPGAFRGWRPKTVTQGTPMEKATRQF